MRLGLFSLLIEKGKWEGVVVCSQWPCSICAPNQCSFTFSHNPKLDKRKRIETHEVLFMSHRDVPCVGPFDHRCHTKEHSQVAPCLQ